MQTDLKAIVHNYLSVLQSRKSSTEMEQFYHPDVIQVEYPNSLTKNLTSRSLQDLKAASERGMHVLQKETYEIINIYENGNTVIAEVIWTGTLNIALGNTPAGGQMRAWFAQFFDFEGDKIIRQRNYDCFEPFN